MGVGADAKAESEPAEAEDSEPTIAIASAEPEPDPDPAEEHEEARLERLAREEEAARQEHYQALHDESAAMEELRLEQLVADQSVHEEKDAADEEAEDATDAMAGLVPRSGPNGTPRLSPAVRATDLPDDLAPLDPTDRQMTEREKARASSWLFVCSLSQSLCSNISLQAKNQMFLDYFAGDFAAHARVMTTLSSVSAIVGFFLKPLFASMTDKYGRKPLLALSPILQSANFFAIALCPMSWIITTLMVQQVLQSFTWETSRIASDAACKSFPLTFRPRPFAQLHLMAVKIDYKSVWPQTATCTRRSPSSFLRCWRGR